MGTKHAVLTVCAVRWQPAVWKGRRQNELEEVAPVPHVTSPSNGSSPRCSALVWVFLRQVVGKPKPSARPA